MAVTRSSPTKSLMSIICMTPKAGFLAIPAGHVGLSVFCAGPVKMPSR